MKPGESIEYRESYLSIFIIKREKNNDFSVVAIPHWDSKYRLPELDWSKPWLPCNDFGLSANNISVCKDKNNLW